MHTLIVYFSHSGNNRLLAEHLAGRLQCDACPIIEMKRRSMFTIFMDMMFQRTPAIEPVRCSVADYERVILIAPIWGSKVAHPMKAFLLQQKTQLPAYAFITLCGHGTPEQHTAITRELTDLTGEPPLAVTELRIGDLMPPEQQDDVKAITRYRATSDDLTTFADAIDAFLKQGATP